MKTSAILAGIALSALVATACSTKPGYVITGTADGAADGDSVFLTDETTRQCLDTAIISGGQFTFSGTADTTRMAIIRCEVAADGSTLAGGLYLENGNIAVTLDSKPSNSKATGTPSNDINTTFKDSINAIVAEMSKIEELTKDTTLTDEQQAAYMAQIDSLYDNKYLSYFKSSAASNIGNAVGIRILSQISYAFELNELDSLVNLVPELYHGDGAYQQLAERVATLKRVDIGQPFVEIAQPGIDGNIVSLSEIVKANKVVMIDFWASWCGPCRHEMPNIVKAYEMYKGKGLEIVGVSQDNDGEAWREAIKTLGMTWPQMSELKMWDNTGIKAYGINSIPNTVIIKDGVIVAHQLTGDELIAKLDELLNN